MVNLTLSLFSGEKLHLPDLAHYSEKDGLYPIQALIQPVSLRFKYHFEGARQTNRVDKVSICIRKSTAVDSIYSVWQPEWYFTHVLNVTHEHRSFMENVIQQILSLTKYQDVLAHVGFHYHFAIKLP